MVKKQRSTPDKRTKPQHNKTTTTSISNRERDNAFLLALHRLTKDDILDYVPLEIIGKEADIGEPWQWPTAQRLTTNGLIEYKAEMVKEYRLTSAGMANLRQAYK